MYPGFIPFFGGIAQAAACTSSIFMTIHCHAFWRSLLIGRNFPLRLQTVTLQKEPSASLASSYLGSYLLLGD